MIKKINIFIFLSVFLQNLDASSLVKYRNAIQYLESRDTVQAILNFQDCANYPSCNDSTYYFLANIHLIFHGDSLGYVANIHQFLKNGNDSPDILFKTGSIMVAKNHGDADNYLKSVLSNQKYKTESLKLLIEYYRNNTVLDSVLKYQMMLTNQQPQDYDLIERNLLLAISKHDLEIIEKLGQKLYEKNRKSQIANLAISLDLFYRGKIEESQGYAILANPGLVDDYANYRPRFHALYSKSKYEQLIRESGKYIDEILKYGTESYYFAKALVKTKRNLEAFPIIEKLHKSLVFSFPEPLTPAIAYFESNRVDEAKAFLLPHRLNGGIEIESLLGRIYEEQDSLLQAVEYYGRALKKSRAPELHLSYGEVCLKLGWLEDAQSSFEHLKKDDPKNGLYLERLHEIYHRLSEYSKLRDILIERLKLDRHNPDLQLQLAKVYSRTGKWDYAMPLLEKVYQQEPNNVPAGLQYAAVLQKTKKYSRALQVLRRINKIDPESAAILQKILHTPDSHLIIDERIRFTKALLVKEPFNSSLRAKYVGLLEQYRPQQRDEYIGELITLYRQRPSDPRSLEILIKELLKEGRNDEAQSYLENLVELDNTSSYLLILSGMYKKKGEINKSLNILEEAYAASPGENLALEIYHLYRLNGDMTKALDFLSRHCGQWPDDARVFLTLSSHIEDQEPRRAQFLAEKAFKLENNKKSAYQVSKLRLINNLAGGQSNSILSLPSRNYSYTSDSLLFLKGMEEYYQGLYAGSIQNLEKISDRLLRAQSREALYSGLCKRRQWESILRLSSGQVISQFSLPEYHAWLEAQYHMGEYPEILNTAVLHPSYVDGNLKTLATVAMAHYKMGEYRDAHELLSACEPVEDLNKDNIWALGRSYYLTGEYKKAERILIRNESLFDKVDSMYYYRSKIKLAMGDTTEAQSILSKGLEINPGSILILRNLASLSFYRNDISKSLKYSKILDRKGGGLDNKKRLARIYLSKGKLKKILNLFTEAELKKDSEALLLLAKAQIDLSMVDEAIATCSKALKKNKKNPESYLFLSQAYERAGNFDKSQKFFHKYSRLMDR